MTKNNQKTYERPTLQVLFVDIYTFRYSGNDIIVCCMPEGDFFSGN